MRATLLGLLLAASLAAFTTLPAAAQSGSSLSETARANAGTVGVISGGIDGTYVRIAADLAAVLDDGERLRVLPILGKGSLQNLADIMYLKGVDVGIVQGDALAYAKRQHLIPGIEHHIQYVTKLYDEELHVLAGKGIGSLQDLAGKKVNVDVRGSGTAMTGSVVFESLGIPVQMTNDDQNTAIEKLKRGEIAGVLYVAGKPARLFADIDAQSAANSGLHLLPVAMTPALLDTYLPSQFSHADYPALVADGKPVDTIAVGSVMAVFDWQPGGERYNKVARFVDAFFGKFQAFLQPPRHPKWKEVNLAAQVPGWTRFPAAQEWLEAQNGAAPPGSPLQRDFDNFVARSGGSRAGMSSADREALFQQFMTWENGQQRPSRRR